MLKNLGGDSLDGPFNRRGLKDDLGRALNCGTEERLLSRIGAFAIVTMMSWTADVAAATTVFTVGIEVDTTSRTQRNITIFTLANTTCTVTADGTGVTAVSTVGSIALSVETAVGTTAERPFAGAHTVEA